MWGQENGNAEARVKEGIIPTRVGTSIVFADQVLLLKDHPHACGDKIYYTIRYISALGSSPRVWGQDAGDGVLTMWERIIPTRVGTSSNVSVG